MTQEFKTGIIIVAIIEVIILLCLFGFSILIKDFILFLTGLTITILADIIVTVLYGIIKWITYHL